VHHHINTTFGRPVEQMDPSWNEVRINMSERNDKNGTFGWLMGNPSSDRPWNILVLILSVVLACGFAWMSSSHID